MFDLDYSKDSLESEYQQHFGSQNMPTLCGPELCKVLCASAFI